MLDALEIGLPRVLHRPGVGAAAHRCPRPREDCSARCRGGWRTTGFALKAVSVFPDNGERGLPTHQGVIALFDEQEGSLLSVMDGEHLTAMRTGGGAAVSVRLLARPDVKTLAILGAGVQGHSHLATVPLTRDFTTIRISSRDPDHAAALACDRSALRGDPELRGGDPRRGRRLLLHRRSESRSRATSGSTPGPTSPRWAEPSARRSTPTRFASPACSSNGRVQRRTPRRPERTSSRAATRQPSPRSVR